MSEPRQPMSQVVVVGSGQVGALAAIAVKRALPACEVTIVAHTGDACDFADRASSALPFANRLHERLGIDENAILARADGSHRLVERYFGWGGEGMHGALPYGDSAIAGAAAFGRAWGGGSRSAEAEGHGGTLNEVLADAGRFRVPAPRENTPLSQVDYAMRWNAGAYHRLLVERAQAIGVRYREAPLTDVEQSAADRIEAITLASGERLSAQLFLDCSGIARVLHSRVTDALPLLWDERQPPQTIVFGRPGQAMIALEDRLSLTRHGWLREFAGRDGLQHVLGVSPVMSVEEAARAMGVEPATTIAVRSGHLAEPWSGNVVGLGDAAAQFVPIGYFHADLAHRFVALLIELLPGASIVPTERAEFNRRAGLMIEGVRHTIGLHFAAPAARAVFPDNEPAPQIASTIDQFTRRGRLPFFDEQPLTVPEKQGLLNALGFAEGVAPQHRGRPAPDRQGMRQAFVTQARGVLSATPPYAEWLAGRLRG